MRGQVPVEEGRNREATSRERGRKGRKEWSIGGSTERGEGKGEEKGRKRRKKGICDKKRGEIERA